MRTAHAVMDRVVGHVAPGARGSLVDAEVLVDATLHAAGSTALIEAAAPNPNPDPDSGRDQP